MADIGLWVKEKYDSVGDQCKAREEELRGQDYISNRMDFVVRVDGRAFHTFTRGLTRPFSTPLRACMRAAATEVMCNLKAQFAYFQSDEITFVFKGGASRDNPEYQHPFGGRVDKLLTIIASLTSVAFYKHAVQWGIVKDEKMLPHFDARLAEVCIGFDKVMEVVMWRENDAIRNAVAMVAQSMFSAKQLNGVNVHKQVLMIDEARRLSASDDAGYLTAYPASFRRGTYIKNVKQVRVLTEEERLQIPEHFRPDEGAEFNRTVTEELHFEDWNLEARQVLWV